MLGSNPGIFFTSFPQSLLPNCGWEIKCNDTMRNGANFFFLYTPSYLILSISTKSSETHYVEYIFYRIVWRYIDVRMQASFCNSLIIAIHHSCSMSRRGKTKRMELEKGRGHAQRCRYIRGTFKAGRTPLLLYRWLISRERLSNRAASYKLQPVRQAEAVVARH